MQTHPRRLLLQKIASRRKIGHRNDDNAVWVTFVSRAVEDSGRAAPRVGFLGRRLLTRREEQVLRLVARGETDRGIAEQLYVSRRTVNTHVSNILAKLDVPSRREAVTTALRLGLL